MTQHVYLDFRCPILIPLDFGQNQKLISNTRNSYGVKYKKIVRFSQVNSATKMAGNVSDNEATGD